MELLELLSGVSSDGGERILARNTAQNQAYFWLVGTNYAGLSDEVKIQRYALATLYFSTEGNNWNDQDGWLTEDGECTWAFGETPCNADGMVVTLDLALNNLRGQLPPEIALLSELKSIILTGDAENSGITGKLPGELGLLTNMERFRVADNEFSGQIPPGLNWPLATVFDVRGNNLSQLVPDDIGLLTSLVEMDLVGNRLSGSLPSSIGILSNLRRLSLSNNTFEDSVPRSIGNLSLLERLNLSHNGFTSLPTTIGNLVNLRSLEAQVNDLSGQLFDNWSSLELLETLDLHDNDLEGPIPASLGKLARIQILDLSHNMFSDGIPLEIGNLSTVFRLFLNSNNLTGNIPPALEGLSVISILRLDDNDLTGAVPSELCQTLGENQVPQFFSDCGLSTGEGKIQCPPGTCCTHCCSGGSCECVFTGSLEFLCL